MEAHFGDSHRVATAAMLQGHHHFATSRLEAANEIFHHTSELGRYAEGDALPVHQQLFVLVLAHYLLHLHH
jgi:hypothetical protein